MSCLLPPSAHNTELLSLALVLSIKDLLATLSDKKNLCGLIYILQKKIKFKKDENNF